MKKVVKKILKIASIVLVSIISLVVLVWGGVNVSKFVIYSEYYSIEENVCINPGLNDGFVCQGITYEKDNDVIIVSGYMKDKTASRLYVTNTNDESYYVSLKNGDNIYKGHAGGVSTKNGEVYVASDNKIFTFDLDLLLNAKNGDTIDIGLGETINNEASFVYTTEDYLYVGEFHDGGQYITYHTYETPEGTNDAIVSQYDINDLSKPLKVYSIRDKVQGICFTPNGKIILSTSFGLSSSTYYVYDESDAIKSEHTLDGAPVYFLDNCLKAISGPAMAEGLDYYKGKIITLTESASDKYIFGKFFFANHIVALDLDK